ncbi:MAG: hypothetical protein LBH25_09055 [Fibromonadaceae bacterium]|jgi:hypothetical protein|nr:hypothetical protein [Fibromonadaceae bacterium]
MRLLALAVPLCIGCASAPVQQQAQPVAEMPELPQCPAGELSGFGFSETEGEAISMAHSDLAKRISLSIKVTTEYAMKQQDFNGKEDISTKYGTEIREEAALANAQDARIAHKKQSGNKIGIAVCMSKADAAKPYIQRQSLLLDSLEFITASELKATHPKQKNEARNKANAIWARMLANNDLLKSWGIESGISMAKDLHDAVEYDYKDYCQTAKLHWNPERETPYSEIVFSKLSSSVKMEKSPCNGRGISLVYRGTEPSCSVKFGLNTCDYAQSLSVSACDGTEYLQLKSDVMGAHQKPDFALEKLQGNLKSAEFWSQWMQEIKQWSPQCE